VDTTAASAVAVEHFSKGLASNPATVMATTCPFDPAGLPSGWSVVCFGGLGETLAELTDALDRSGTLLATKPVTPWTVTDGRHTRSYYFGDGLFTLCIVEDEGWLVVGFPPEDYTPDRDAKMVAGQVERVLASGPFLPITAPRLMLDSAVPPDYPVRAREANQSGYVQLELEITDAGIVDKASVLSEQPAGFGFAKAAKRAVRQRRYRPAAKVGKPTELRVRVMVVFNPPAVYSTVGSVGLVAIGDGGTLAGAPSSGNVDRALDCDCRGVQAVGDEYWLPEISLAEPQGAAQPYKRSYSFIDDDDWFTRHIPIWEEALASLRGKPNIHYLEIGVFEGRSVIWMVENILTHPSSRLTVIDPFGEYEHYADPEQTFRDNVELSGATDRTTIIKGFSQEELRKLPLRSFDIIYIDGDHSVDSVLEDAVLCWRLLKDGGILIFDDYEMPQTPPTRTAMNTFVRFYGKHFNIMHRDWQLILQKR
jgi:TonB family protein